MSFNKKQFKDLIERTLHHISLYSPEAVKLLLGTAAQESLLGTYLVQTVGPAIGVFQMEPASHNDLIKWLREQRPELYDRIMALSVTKGSAEEMEWNLKYAICMARVYYLRKPGSLPSDVNGMAAYWKKHWNTFMGKGTPAQFVANFHKYVGDV